MPPKKPPNAGKGRPLGSKNKASSLLRDRLAGSPDDPVAVLIELQRSGRADIRLAAAKALLPMVYPRLGTLDIRADHRPKNRNSGVLVVPATLSPEEWIAAGQARAKD